MVHRRIAPLTLAALLHAPRLLACGYDPCGEFETCLAVPNLNIVDGLGCTGKDRSFLDTYNDSRVNLALLYALATGQTYGPAPDEPAGDAGGGAKAYTDLLNKFVPAEKPAKAPEIDIYSDESVVCRSNSYQSASLFLTALAAADIPDAARGKLAALRNHIFDLCHVAYGQPPPDPSALLADVAAVEGDGATKEFQGYLKGAALFYAGHMDDALAAMGALNAAKNPWIKETAAMVQGRVFMVRAQREWSGYANEQAKIHKDDLAKADEAFAGYLSAFPKGRYQASVFGLRRRLKHLAQEQDAFLASYLDAWRSALTTKQPLYGPNGAYGLIAEAETATPYIKWHVDGDFVGGVKDDPLLFAAGALQFLRINAGTDKDRLLAKAIDANATGASAPRGLAHYLHAVDSAAHEDWEGAVKAADAIGADKGSLLAVSGAVIKAHALEELKRWNDAEGLWKSLVQAAPPPKPADKTQVGFTPGARTWLWMLGSGPSEAYQAFAAGYTRTVLAADHPSALLTKASPLSADERVPAYALRHLFKDNELAAAVAAPDTLPVLRREALEVLLMRRLLRQDWAGFLKAYDVATPVDRQAFGPAETAVRTLAKFADDPKGLLNVGYFVHVNAERRWSMSLCESKASVDTALSNRLPQEYKTPNAVYADPLSYYRRVMVAAAGDDETHAKALYHAILCFKPGSESAACRFNKASEEIPEGTRKAWFNTLKAAYKGTSWATKAKYWY